MAIRCKSIKSLTGTRRTFSRRKVTPPKRDSRGGFTYVEALAALVLTSLLTTAIVLSNSVFASNLTYSWKAAHVAEQSEIVRGLLNRAMDMADEILVTPYIYTEGTQDWTHLAVSGASSKLSETDYVGAKRVHREMLRLCFPVNYPDSVRGYDNSFFDPSTYGAGFTVWFVAEDGRAFGALNIIRDNSTLRVQAVVPEGALGNLFGHAGDYTTEHVIAEYEVEYMDTSVKPYRDAITPATYYLSKSVEIPQGSVEQYDGLVGYVPCVLIRLPSPYDVDAVDAFVLFSPQTLFVEHSNMLVLYTKSIKNP
jgi:type II secretory pathway pseudopilin PulG